MTAVLPNEKPQGTEQPKYICGYCKKHGHVQNTKPPTSKPIAHCPQCQRTNHSPEKTWNGPIAANRPKRFKQDPPAEKAQEGQEQESLTHSGAITILKNILNWKRHNSNRQIAHQ